MSTILEQAVQIRDATGQYANTPTIVGQCLVDIANALLAGGVLNSASFNMLPVTPTVVLDNTPVPMSIGSITQIKTGTIEILEGDGFFYFGGLDPTKAYKISCAIGFVYDDAVDIGFSFKDLAGADIAGCSIALSQGKGFTNDGLQNMVLDTTITGTETCVLYFLPGGASTLSANLCSASIIQTGPVLLAP